MGSTIFSPFLSSGEDDVKGAQQPLADTESSTDAPPHSFHPRPFLTRSSHPFPVGHCLTPPLPAVKPYPRTKRAPVQGPDPGEPRAGRATASSSPGPHRPPYAAGRRGSGKTDGPLTYLRPTGYVSDHTGLPAQQGNQTGDGPA